MESRGENSHQLAVGYPISGGVYAQRAEALVLELNRGIRHRFLRVRGPFHRLYRVLKPQQMQPANTGESRDEIVTKVHHIPYE
jgi:hypothetical protein